jgi:hypothetical protein
MMDTSKMVFVFGSNTAGIHGSGAAKYAYKNKGARWGSSYGHIGDSFAVPTKGHFISSGGSHMVGNTLSLPIINRYVQGFLAYAETHSELTFQVTCLGCGLAGLRHENVAPMFRGWEHTGMFFDEAWQPYLQNNAKFWGTF